MHSMLISEEKSLGTVQDVPEVMKTIFVVTASVFCGATKRTESGAMVMHTSARI